MHLNRPVKHPLQNPSHMKLDQRDLIPSRMRPIPLNHLGNMKNKQSRGIHLRAAFSNPVLHHLLPPKRLPR